MASQQQYHPPRVDDSGYIVPAQAHDSSSSSQASQDSTTPYPSEDSNDESSRDELRYASPYNHYAAVFSDSESESERGRTTHRHTSIHYKRVAINTAYNPLLRPAWASRMGGLAYGTMQTPAYQASSFGSGDDDDDDSDAATSVEVVEWSYESHDEEALWFAGDVRRYTLSPDWFEWVTIVFVVWFLCLIVGWYLVVTMDPDESLM